MIQHYFENIVLLLLLTKVAKIACNYEIGRVKIVEVVFKTNSKALVQHHYLFSLKDIDTNVYLVTIT